PFALTGAQKRCLAEISADMEGQRPMARLLQGDVGSGKTAVAAGAAAACVASGHRAAVMAPTEILAEQHQSAFADLLAPLGFRTFGSPGNGATIALLVGSLPAREKERIRSAARDGEVDVLIGTHALIQNRVAVKGLALVVVDEQHRFGVLQRAELVAKGDGGGVPHQMVMTATPIPRTLSMVLDASLDQSIIDEMPPGRRPAETLLLSPNDRERAYQFIRHRVAMGEQAFVVCPLVEASDGVSAEAAIVEYDRLTRDVYPDLTVGLVHGRMAPAEKEAAMAAFRSGEMSILVATTVIEVGVDVPNATVMMVQDADRFGLAQLHQLRGRVGRGTAGGTCILLTGSDAPRALRRLEAVAKTSDGLELAALDLEIRGPGDFFGVRQAGEADGLRFARAAPPDTLSQAARVAAEIIAADPDLAEGRHAGLARLVTARGADPLPT
ncbi:MAG: ATP-dependent DNA helicase RecG, partial [Anaerolineae bacterium]